VIVKSAAFGPRYSLESPRGKSIEGCRGLNWHPKDERIQNLWKALTDPGLGAIREEHSLPALEAPPISSLTERAAEARMQRRAKETREDNFSRF